MAYAKIMIMGACAAALSGACATPQNNPYAKYSSKMPAEQTQQYAQNTAPAQAPVTYRQATTVEPQTAPSYVQSARHTQTQTYTQAAYPQPVTYQAGTYQASSPQANMHQECLASQGTRKLAGAAIGGTIGAYAGKKLGDDDTAAMIGGAAVGGIAGYGVGGMTKNCDQYNVAPVAKTVVYPAQAQPVTSAVTYQQSVSAVTYQQPALTETGGQNLSQAEMQSIDAYQYDNNGYVSNAAATAPAQVSVQRLYDAPAQAVMPAAPQAVQTPALQGVTYIVQEGDTAWNLSRRTCSSVNDIKAMNSLEGDFLIKAGEAIRLPASAC